MSETQNPLTSRDPTLRLQSAIETLEKFNKKKDPQSYFNASVIDENSLTPSSPLSKTISLAKGLISDQQLHTNVRNFRQLREELLDAIGIVKSHHKLLEVLKVGDEEQKLLAERAMQAFEGYNAIIENIKEAPQSIGYKIANYFFKKTGASTSNKTIPKKISLPDQLESGGESEKKSVSDRVMDLADSVEVKSCPAVTGNEADAFRMKAISLLRKHSISFKDIQQTLHHAPIKAHFDCPEANTTLLDVHQTLSPFPGEVIILKGSFKRDRRNFTHSMPIAESFQLCSQASQTGFPHQLQYTGWALSDVLIPDYPQRPDQMGSFTSLLDEKAIIAKELLPEGSLNSKAKELLKNKVEAFNEKSDYFLELHRKLLHAIVVASEHELSTFQPVLDKYITSVMQHPSPYHYMSETHAIIMENFVAKSFHSLQRAWVERSEPLMFDCDSNIVAKAVSDYLARARNSAREEIEELKKSVNNEVQTTLLEFLLSFGLIITEGSEPIVCQLLSETMNFRPPMLSDFQRKLQASAIHQLAVFFKELESEDELPPAKQIEYQLHRNIALFEANKFDAFATDYTDQVYALEDYYNTRHFQRILKNSD